MKLIKPSAEILTPINGMDVLKAIEIAARTCYKSEDKITDDSAKKLVSGLLKSGHEAMIEFFDITVKFTCDRGVSHEIVRHRVASYAQESTRYCNYSKDKFGNQLTFIIPSQLIHTIKEGEYKEWDSKTMNGTGYTEMDGNADSRIFMGSLYCSEQYYNSLTSESMGWSAQQARAVLPSALKTEINVKMNLREWRHFFKLRCAQAAHPDMRELTIPLLEKMHNLVPIIFDDLYEQFSR